jgi:hypothetical protein
VLDIAIAVRIRIRTAPSTKCWFWPWKVQLFIVPLPNASPSACVSPTKWVVAKFVAQKAGKIAKSTTSAPPIDAPTAGCRRRLAKT